MPKRKPKGHSRNGTTSPAVVGLDEALARAGVPTTWDVLIVGDGAGCWWDKVCGWGCTLIDRHLGRRRAFYGGLSSGSIAIAELLPTVHAMLWYDEFQGKAARQRLGRPVLNVHVITDSETTFHHAAALAPGPKTAKLRRERPLWNVLIQLERAGYLFQFHWVPRQSLGLNILGDRVAGIASKTIAQFRLDPDDHDGRALDREIYMINPSP